MDSNVLLEGFGATVTPDEYKDLMARGVRRPFRRGAFLMTEGEASDHVIVLVSGRAKVSSYTKDGKEVVLAVRGPGELLGELSAVDGNPRSATVSALEPIEALIVRSEQFVEFLTEHPRLAIQLLQSTIRRLRDSDRKRIEFGAYDTPARVARRLLELVDRYGEAEAADKSVRISLSLTQDELAGWTGSSREAVSKALREFRDHRWITTGRRAIVVLDVEGLRGRAL
ncbi:MAG: Crp/Fnr family transcriptional regulator [Actinomycetota bacterium]